MQNKGLSLIEILIALGILGMVFVVSTQLFGSTQQVVSRQVVRSAVVEDTERAFIRLSEIVSQAAYIYPLGSTVLLPNGANITTGDQALALLVPSRTPYCKDLTNSQPEAYCGYTFSFESRSSFDSLLGKHTLASGSVLVERQLTWLSWATNTVPTLDWTSQSASPQRVVADSLDTANSSLGGLTLAGRNGILDKTLLVNAIDATGSMAPVLLDEDTALIGGMRLVLQIAYTNGIKAARSESIMARGVPRTVKAGVGN